MMFRFVSRISVLVSSLLLATTALGAPAPKNCLNAYVAKNYGVAAEACWAEAQIGSAESAFTLAVLYAKGLGVPLSHQESVHWLIQAAEAGHGEAAYNLGMAYAQGDGVEMDMQRAVAWFEQGAIAGNAKAQRDLATLYESGYSVEKNLPRAYQLYLASAEQGVAVSQLKAGLMLLRGEGVPHDPQQAEVWLKKAAAANDAVAQYTLGVMKADTDPESSAYWYERSAKQGNAYAMYNLALLYYYGRGVEKNYQIAQQWGEKSLAGGVEESESLLMQIQRAQNVSPRPSRLPEPAVSVAERKAPVTPATQQKQLLRDQDKSASAVAAPSVIKPSVAESSVAESPEAGRSVTTYTEPKAPAVSVPPRPESVATTSFKPGLVEVKERGWLMAMPDHQYLIQISRQYSEAKAHAYLKRYALADEVSIYREVLPDKTSYIVTYGHYGSLKAAKAAAKQLPAGIQKYKPWVRSYRNLKNALTAVAAKPVAPAVTPDNTPANKPVTAIVETKQTPAVQVQPAQPAVATGANVAVTEAGMKDGDWLLKRRSERIAVQLLARKSRRLGEVKSYLRSQGILDEVVYYETQREAGPYVVVVLAKDFTRYSDARAAVKQLPVAVQNAKPWVRTWGSLQNKYRPLGQ